MRILTLTNLYPNPFQPTKAIFNRDQVRALAAEHSMAVIAPIMWTDELFARIWRQGPLPRERRRECDGVPIYHPCYFFPPFVLRGWHGTCFRNSVAAVFDRVRAEFRPQLLFAPWAYPDGWAACELGHKAGLPVVVKVHGSDILTLRDYPERLPSTLEALRRSDGIIAVSQDLANRVIELGIEPQRVHVVYDGVDEGLFHPGPQIEARQQLGFAPWERIILYVGNLVPVKGLDILIQACGMMIRKGEQFACYLIGDGPLRRRLQRDIKRWKLEKNVHLLGTLNHEQLPNWYRAATVCVLPSFSEGVPNVLLEAAASRIPFVASRVGGIPEIAHLGRSQLVPPADAPALAEALSHFLRSPPQAPPELAGSMRSHAQAAFELAAVFESVLNCSRPQVSLATMCS